MEEDKGPQLQIEFQEVTLALTSKKTDALKKIKYLKITHPATGHLSESFNKPTRDKKTQEIKFDLRRKKSACFKLQFKHDANGQQNVNTCGIELEVMRNTERDTVAKFDVDNDRVNELIRREIHSESEKYQRIEVAYKVLKVQPLIENTVNNNHTTLSNGCKDEEMEMKSMNGSSSSSFEEGDDIRSREEEAKFKPNSCIMVVGTTGRGKTTTMNLFTGNKEMIARKGQTAAITRKEKLCPDLKHQSSNPAQIWPEWMDTEGLDAAGAKHDNEKLLRRYLEKLKDSKKKWIHAIIWCITPEPKEDTRLSEQARFISMFENEERERSIWENVIILARKGFNNRDDEGFQGALAAVPNNFKDTVQCIGYNLDTSQPGAISEDHARKILEKAIQRISEPVSLFFRNEVCIDCGKRGDRRLMANTCHLMKFEPTRLPGKKKVCSQCKECSYRIICGYPWRFTSASPCVGWGNHVDPGLTVAPPEKTQHEL